MSWLSLLIKLLNPWGIKVLISLKKINDVNKPLNHSWTEQFELMHACFKLLIIQLFLLLLLLLVCYLYRVVYVNLIMSIFQSSKNNVHMDLMFMSIDFRWI